MMKKECLEIVEKKCQSCKSCALGATRTNLVFSDGNPETARIVLIGEAPGETEDLEGKPFVGRAGQLINTVKCRPPENRVPTDLEKACCSKFLKAQIDIIKPQAIVLCGATALKSFVELDKKTTISKVRGQWMTISVDGVDYRAITIFHPSYLLRNHSMEEGSPRRLMQQDLAEIKNQILSDRNWMHNSQPQMAGV